MTSLTRSSEPVSCGAADMRAAFEAIRKRRAFHRRHFQFLKTVVDFDITCEIGYSQLMGRPLCVKQLLLLNLAPAVSVVRHLDKLCRANVVTRTPSRNDRRVHELRVVPGVLLLYAAYADLEGEPGMR
jgi:hypothetical protein